MTGIIFSHAILTIGLLAVLSLAGSSALGRLAMAARRMSQVVSEEVHPTRRCARRAAAPGFDKSAIVDEPVAVGREFAGEGGLVAAKRRELLRKDIDGPGTPVQQQKGPYRCVNRAK